MLYYIEKDGTVRIIPPAASREKLFKDAHGGAYGAHLREAKLYGQLSKHYWWPKMRSDVEKWCRGCLTCATRQPGCAVKPVLTPIPVSGPFDRVGVDVIHFPKKSASGNSYVVVFVDYLTKWPEVFATPDQTTLTIAKLLVEQIISRHSVPKELLSDRGPAFLLKVMCDVYRLLGVCKLSTSAYHPRTDGLVEHFNRTLTSMLAKKQWKKEERIGTFVCRSSYLFTDQAYGVLQKNLPSTFCMGGTHSCLLALSWTNRQPTRYTYWMLMIIRAVSLRI